MDGEGEVTMLPEVSQSRIRLDSGEAEALFRYKLAANFRIFQGT